MSDIKLEFAKFVSEGSHYEIGKAIGKALPEFGGLFKINVADESADKQKTAEKKKLIDEFCPGVFDEITGLADGLGLSVEKLTIMSDFSVAGGCSQFIALPNITKNGDVLFGRGYEFDPNDELCLCITRAEGKPAHIGFSLLLIGRFDGMNEHGFAVSMSTCEFVKRSSGGGLWFPLVLRSLLDNCKNVEDARHLLKTMPIRSNINIAIADKSGNAAVAEVLSVEEGKSVYFRENEDYIIATNHYLSKGALASGIGGGRHSTIRYDAVKKALSEEKGSVTEGTIKSILGRKVPEGTYCPFYKDGLGTLHSMVFNLTKTEVEVCIGLPAPHKWEKIAFDTPVGTSLIIETVTNEYAENPGEFWPTLPPDELNIMV